MRVPGPRQVFNSKIIAIRFPSIGGLAYIRAKWTWIGNRASPSPVARIEDLPGSWGTTFNIFDFKAVEDADAKKDPKVAAASIVNPVTDLMLQRYKMWQQYPNAVRNEAKSTPGGHFLVLDTANWTLIYANHTTSRVSRVMTREAALAEFRGLVGSPGYENLDPTKMGVAVTTNTGGDFTEAELEAIVASGLWTAHYEDFPGTTFYTRNEGADAMINLRKLFVDQPKVNGKKQTKISFKVFLPTYDKGTSGNAAGQLWTLQGAVYKSTVTKPTPQDDERLNYSPVVDRAVSDGTGYTYDMQLPTWKGWPQAEVIAPSGWTDGAYVLVTITYGVLKVPPKIEMEFVGDAVVGPIG